MAIQINRIEIRNFRSVRNLVITPHKLAVLVGQNDSGKSNVLRALNLFFNGETDPGEGLRFDIDHNIFNRPNRRAKEISVKLEIELPPTYHHTNGEFVVWEKRWRGSGSVPMTHGYKGQRRIERGQGTESIVIPAKSNVHSLLRNIRFVYVPAIKDPEYFSDLRASIYNVIADVADRNFRHSSREFERSIADQLLDLTTEISNSLGLRSRLALPRDLSHIFESLDFLSEDQHISLEERGDGIKARHIPLILKFMADKRRSLQNQGAPPHSFIWGYEEPENNLELASCVALADQLGRFVNGGISQILLTTHSPVFYNLGSSKKSGAYSSSCHHIYRDTEENGTKETLSPSDLDERMGTMALFAPLAKELEDRIRQRGIARSAVAALACANTRILFVEGPSDRFIMEKALQVFTPDLAEKIDVETSDQGAGYNYVVDMLSSWTGVAKHTPHALRAAGLVDLDPDATKAAGKWNKVPANVRYAKCFKIETPPHIVPAYQCGFRVPIVLETLYGPEAWRWADGNGYLVDRADLWKLLPRELHRRILNNETTLAQHLKPGWDIYVRREFHPHRKVPMAEHISGKPDAEFRQQLAVLKPVVDKIVAYLFPEPEAGQ